MNLNELESTLTSLIDNFESLDYGEKEEVLNELSLINESCSLITSSQQVIESSPSFEREFESKVENKSNLKRGGLKL